MQNNTAKTRMEYIYESPSIPPQESPHWKSLNHQADDRIITDIFQLKTELQNDDSRLALWSALLGYCESLCTSTNVRYNPYPIPIDALERLVKDEFSPPQGAASHRDAARDISNWVWAQVVQKSNIKDEKHANSVYTVLRGSIEKKSVDCFGAALATVIALRQQGYDSVLTLSEDHAYESHGENETCEVAIPGTTVAQKQKRGQDISSTFEKKELNANDSWLYMAGNAVQCRSNSMMIAAMLANTNCMIEYNSNFEKFSEPLLIIKRELLWMLKDCEQISQFPFALCELGWSEEHITSERGDARVSIEWESSTVQVTAMEKLYHEAVGANKLHYNDKQVYPYAYLGFFHKDGGQEEECRLALALQFFSEAARVASSYKYDSGDTLQLTKVFTKISDFIVSEILCCDGNTRVWQDADNTVAATKWLLVFYDYLLLWEEKSGCSQSFLPICSPQHKTGISKAFSQLSPAIRQEALKSIRIQSKRLGGPLRLALEAKKLVISEMHLTILVAEHTKRRRKRKLNT